MTTSDINQAKAKKLVGRISQTGVRKVLADPKMINSLGTKRDYIGCVKLYLDWRSDRNLPSDTQDIKSDLLEFLEDCSEYYQQKTLCQMRMALGKVFLKKLPYVKSLLDTVHNSRDYPLSEVLELINNVTEKNAISILLCFYSGFRAHELCTIKRLDEGERSTSRKWMYELFAYENDYLIYLVTGKGGLCRQVCIPTNLAEVLESRRFPHTKRVRDREIYYEMRYDIGYGQALSQCFTRASKKVLGWSTGLHGLRHAYTKNRVRKLMKNGYSFDSASRIISQELGHFRASIVGCYLR